MTDLESHLKGQLEQPERYFWHRLRWRAIAPYIPQDRPIKLLDVGAGQGVLGRLLKVHRPDVSYCFDEPIPSLERHLVEEYGTQANLRSTGSVEDVDIITLLDVIEHVEDDREFVESLLAKAGGRTRFVVTVPALSMLWSDWDRALGHHRRYNRKSLQAAFAGLPVHLVALNYLFPELVVPGMVRKLLSLRREHDPDQGPPSEMPPVRPFMNELLALTGRPFLWKPRWNPFGSSLVAVLDHSS